MKVNLGGDAAWRLLLTKLLNHGTLIAPRGEPTLEILHENSISCYLADAVVCSPARKLNYQFMAAEALWILSGSNELSPLTRFIKRFTQYSDDGKTLFGAYGPHVVKQFNYVLDTLIEDRATRRATLTIWRQNPPTTKDYPCTIAMTFSIRDDQLHQHVYMRSSDAWLGIPYDLFSFSCIGLKLACSYNMQNRANKINPGTLTISMTSSHLYVKDKDAAVEVGREAFDDGARRSSHNRVNELVADGDWQAIEDSLIACRENLPPATWMWRIRP